MEKTMSGILIEAVLRTTLKKLKDDPERGIRNLVDMGLRFSRTPFQQRFFRRAQAMLENENSPYYDLVRDLFTYADTDRLLRIGMDLGYHGCVCGSRQIRDSERRLGCRVPWTVLFQMDAGSPDRLEQYDAAVSEGEGLGIYTWLLFPSAAPEEILDLVRAHPASAFFLFCEPESVLSGLTDSFTELQNLVPVLRCREDMEMECARLRDAGIPYCVWYPYSREDLPAIRSGDLLVTAQQARPVFTILAPRPDCPDAARCQAGQAVERARNEQLCRTIPLELEWDGLNIQRIISGGASPVCFDPSGHPLGRDGGVLSPAVSLFSDGLTGAFRVACGGNTSEVSA